MLFLLFSPRVQRLFIALFMGVYLALVYGLDVPGCGRGSLSETCNALEYIDRQVFSARFVSHANPTTPEGLLSTLPALLTTWYGVEAGRYLIAVRANIREQCSSACE